MCPAPAPVCPAPALVCTSVHLCSVHTGAHCILCMRPCEPKSLILRFIAHSRFQAKPATLLIPSDFFFLFAVLYGTWYQSGSFSLINMMGSGFHCLRSFFLLFPPLITHHCFVACRLCHSGDSFERRGAPCQLASEQLGTAEIKSVRKFL